MIDTNGGYTPKRQRLTEFHQVRGLRYALHCWQGSGPEILFLLHGYGDCGPAFELLVDALPSRWTIIAPDWRGFGDSEWSNTGYWFPDYFADLDKILDIKSPSMPVNLAGHSMGGNVAAFYAGIRPNRVRRLALLEGFGLPESLPTDAPGRYAKWLGQIREQRPARLYQTIEQLAEGLRKRYPEMTSGEALFAARHWCAPKTTGWALKSDPSHQWTNPILYQRQEAINCWQQITSPVLVVGSEYSPFAAAADEFVASLSISDNEINTEQLPEVGHMFHIQAPQLLAEKLTKFFGGS